MDVAVVTKVTFEVGWGCITDGRYGNRGLGADGRLEQGGMKGKDCGAVGAGALGEEDNGQAGLECGGNLARGRDDGGAAVTVHEDGAAEAGHHAEEGPAEDIVLGDEETGCGRGKDEDIEIAEVVRDNHAVAGNGAREV